MQYSDIRFVWFALTGGMILFGCSQPIPETISPSHGLLQATFTETAETALPLTYTLTTPLSGTVLRIESKPGDTVSRGQLLASLDETPFNQSFIASKAQVDALKNELALNSDHLAQAAAQYEHDLQILSRYELVPLQSTPETLSQLKHQVTVSQIQLNMWDKQNKILLDRLAMAETQQSKSLYQLEQTAITAPINGTVIKRHTQGGVWLNSGESLLDVGDTSTLVITSNVLTSQATKLKLGQSVKLGTDGEAYPHHGTLSGVAPMAQKYRSPLGIVEYRTKVVIQLDDPAPSVWGIHYKLYAKFITAERQNALFVPRYSVLQDANKQYYVLKVVDKKMIKQPITLGIQSTQQIEITKGLSAKDIIVKAPTTLTPSTS